MRALPWVVVGCLLSCSSDPGSSSAQPTVPDDSEQQPADEARETQHSGQQGVDDSSSDSAESGAFAAGAPAVSGATEAEMAVTQPGTPVAQLRRVLVFTRTTGYRHDSIGAGVAAFEQLGLQNEFSVQQTEQSVDFNDDNLAEYDVVVWLSTTLDVLNDEQQSAFERYIQAGGGWVGVHAASDTEYDWAWYGGLLGGGAWFEDHPNGTPTASLTVDVDNAAHGSTQHLPARFEMQDEWYNFRANPAAEVNVLLRLDESTYNANQGASGAMGADHPIAWYRGYDGGRAWYTGLGHRRELYRDPRFLQHLLGGLRWAAGWGL